MSKHNSQAPEGGTLWLTSEAITRVPPESVGEFLEKSAKLISLIKKPIPHSFQDCIKDWNRIRKINLEGKILITPEPWSKALFDPTDVVPIEISRLTNIISWRKDMSGIGAYGKRKGQKDG